MLARINHHLWALFAVVLSTVSFISCGMPESGLDQGPHKGIGFSYNSLPSTFDQIRVHSVHAEGYRGAGINIRFQDVDHINFLRPELSHTLLPGRLQTSGTEGHATGMALIAAGAITSHNAGIAPGAKIISEFEDEDQAHIISNSILGTNLLTCGYKMPEDGSGIRQGVYLTPPEAAKQIYVIIAGNSGPHTPTNMGWGIPDNYYPIHGNIIVTVAVDKDNRITSTSSSCGKTGLFCIAVPSPGPTSPTAPIVAGTLALLMEAVPGRPLNHYVDAILKSATPLPHSTLAETGVGLLNVEAALHYLRTN